MRSYARSLVVAGALVALSQSGLVGFQATPRSVWDGVYSEEQAKRAEPLYADKCSSCHGIDLTGATAPLVGREFAANWNDLSLELMSERIRLTMPTERMGTLSRAQVADL